MKVVFKALTENADKVLLDWALLPKNKKDCEIVQENPTIIKEVFEDKSVNWMLKKTAEKMGLPTESITSNHIYQNSVNGKFLRKASKKLKIDKKEIEIKVEK